MNEIQKVKFNITNIHITEVSKKKTYNGAK